MSKLKKLKLPALIVGIAAASLILVAVILGVLNALVGDGKWNLGWSDYRYDDSAYTVGNGTVYAENITSVSIDWIDGKVQIIPCEDDFISLTEISAVEVTDESRVRWCVSEDGKTLSVRYRASSWFFGNSQNKQKILTLRIPQKMLADMERIAVNCVSTDVVLTDLCAETFDVQTVSGEITLSGCSSLNLKTVSVSGDMTFTGEVRGTVTCESKSGEVKLDTERTPKEIDVETVSGKIKLSLPSDAALEVQYKSKANQKPVIDFSYDKKGSSYVCGPEEDRSHINVKTVSGKLTVTY